MTSSSPPDGPGKNQADDLLTAGNLLRATLDSSMDMIQVFDAVRNERGDIVDFKWILNNHASEKIYGNVVGQSLLQLQPGVVQEGIFEAFKQVVETGEPQQYEKHYVHEQFNGWFRQSVVKLNGGVATTTSDITSLKMAEEDSQQSKAFLQDIINTPSIGIAVYRAIRNEQGQIVDFVHEFINRITKKTLNEDFTGKLLSNHGEVGLAQLARFIEVIESNVANSYVMQIELSGRQRWLSFSNTPLEGDRLVHTWEDVSELKRADQEILRLKDEAAQNADSKYQKLVNAIHQGFALCELVRDENGRGIDHRILEHNPAFEKQTGLSLNILQGRTAREAFPTLDWWWTEAYTNVVDTGVPMSSEHYLKETDRWYEVGAYPIQGDQFAVLYNDISDRKKAEQQQTFLLKFSDTLRTESSADAVATCAIRLLIAQLSLDRSYTTTYYLEKGRAEVDYQIGNDHVAPLPEYFVLSDYPDAFKTTFEKTVVIEDDWERQGLSEEEKRNSKQLGMRAMMGATLRKENKPLWSMVAISSRPRKWTKSEISLLEEVAERTWSAIENVKAEEAFRQSQKRFQSVANLVPDLLWDSEPDGSTNWYNDRWLEYTGQTLEEATGWGWVDAIHPDDRKGSAKRYGQAVETGKPLQQEHRIRRHDGAYRWFMISASPVMDANGRVVKMYGSATDIHDRRQAEDALRKNEQRLNLALDATELAIYEWDLISDRLTTNNRFKEMVGIGPNEPVIGSHVMGNIVHPDDRAHIDPALALAMDSSSTGKFVFEHRLSRNGPLGQPWILSHGQVFFDGPGDNRQPFQIFGTLQDITERKQREEQQEFLLKLSEALRTIADPVKLQETAVKLLAEHLQVMRASYYEVEADQESFWMTARYEIDAIPIPDRMRLSDYSKTLSDDYRSGRTTFIRDSEKETRFDVNHRQAHRALGIRAWAAVPLVKNGQLVAVVGVHSKTPRNWTATELQTLETLAQQTWAAVERAKAEEALRQSEEKYRTLFETMSQGYQENEVIRDENGNAVDHRLLNSNPQFERLTGLKLADCIGKPVKEIMPESDDFWLELFDRVVRTGIAEHCEREYAVMSRWYEVDVFPVGGDKVGVLMEDITERKQHEQQQEFLLKLSDLLRKNLADVATIQSAALKLLAEQFNVMRAIYYEGEPDQNTFTLTARFEKDAVPIPDKLRLSDFSPIVADEYRSGRTQMVTDTENEPYPEAYRAIGLRAWLSFCQEWPSGYCYRRSFQNPSKMDGNRSADVGRICRPSLGCYRTGHRGAAGI